MQAGFAMELLLVQIVNFFRVKIFITYMDTGRSIGEVLFGDSGSIGSSQHVPGLSDWFSVLSFAGLLGRDVPVLLG